MSPRLLLPILVSLLTAVSAPAGADDILSGPVSARVLRVIDGDTVEAEALVWPGHSVRVSIRVRGVDAPELRSGCEAEKVAARAARAVLAEIVADGMLEVRNIGADKYFGRVVADVTTGQGVDIARELVSRAAARPYDGGKRLPFCHG